MSITITSVKQDTCGPTGLGDVVCALPGVRGGGDQLSLFLETWTRIAGPGNEPASPRGQVGYPPSLLSPAFVHVPTITLMRGGVPTVINGPVEPVVPRITPATALGWEKYFKDRLLQSIARSKTDREAAEVVRAFFETRRQKKADESNGRYIRYCERKHKSGSPILSRDDFERERFDASYARACERAAAKGNPPPDRDSHGKPPLDWLLWVKAPELIEKMSALRRMGHNSERLERFHHPGGLCADRRTDSFVEQFADARGNRTKALRTTLALAFELYSSALPKDIVYGRNKETVYEAALDGTSAMDARDQEYIETCRVRRCLFVADVDGWWPSVKALWKALRQLLPPHLMPNLISYRSAEDGRHAVENPHLIWLLPPGSRVIPGEGRNTERQHRLHKMIQRGIVNHLLELGADPGHYNSDKMKNPISPKWSAIACDENFATMDEWRAFLPTITPDPRSMRGRAKQLKAERTGNIEAELSSAMWHDAVVSRRLAIRSAQRCQNPEFLEARRSHAAFVEWLYHPETGVVAKRMRELYPDGKGLRSILSSQREFVIELGKIPASDGQFCDRGRDAKSNLFAQRGFKPANAEERAVIEIERKSRAGKRSRANERAINCALLAEELERLMSTGLTIEDVIADKATVVKTLVASGNLSRATAYRLFDEVAAVVSEAARYQAGLIPDQNIELVNPVVVISNPVSIRQAPQALGNPARIIVKRPADVPEVVFLAWRQSWTTLQSWRRIISCRRTRARQDDADIKSGDPAKNPCINVNRSFWHRRRQGTS